MPDIVHDVLIKAPPERVFRAVSTPEGLDTWWSKHSTGTPRAGEEYTLGFGPGYTWRATVTRFVPNSEFELRMTDAHADWQDTRVGIRLEEQDGRTVLHFSHSGWPSANDHYRVSCNCWALYLRILRRSLEYGESVPYEDRLDV